jgi:type I restriction enzyme, S subunit
VSRLPPGWATASLFELSEVVRGITFPASAKEPSRTDTNVCCLRTTNIQREVVWSDVYFVPREFVKRESQFVQIGDILMSMANSYELVGKVAVVKSTLYPTAFGAFLGAIRPRFAIQSQYLFHFLRTDYAQRALREGSSQTTNIANIAVGTAGRIPVSLAPLAEQVRVADKLDALLARVDACREHMDRVPALLKRFRQAVLAAATGGELTRDWREERGNDDERQSFDLYDAEAIRDYSFPAHWRTQRLSDIATITGGVTKDSKKQSAAFTELPYLRVANVQRGFLDLTEMKTIRVPPDRANELLLRAGDILFNEGGDIDKLGRGWVWNDELPTCVFQNHVFRARLFDPRFQPRYFSWYGNSRGYAYFLARGKQTTNLASINKSLLSALPVAVPPAEEQAEIVRRVESLFALADSLEARYTTARAQVDRLTPALLAKAFRGELVPQDPNDEPASELLARIRESKSEPTRRAGRGRRAASVASD